MDHFKFFFSGKNDTCVSLLFSLDPRMKKINKKKQRNLSYYSRFGWKN